MDVDEESDQNVDLAPLDTPKSAFIRGFDSYAINTQIACAGPNMRKAKIRKAYKKARKVRFYTYTYARAKTRTPFKRNILDKTCSLGHKGHINDNIIIVPLVFHFNKYTLKTLCTQ